MELASVLDIILSIVTMGVVPLIFWIRGLQSKFDGVSAQIKANSNQISEIRAGDKEDHKELARMLEKMVEDTGKEHYQVGEALTSIRADHAEHTATQAEMKVLLEILERRSDKR